MAALPAYAQSLGPGGNVIIPDGRTQTELNVNGATTDITTGSMAGGNAYNSFSQFRVGENNTVNLHVPGSANYLINIVRDGPVMVDGTLNALKNGRIGGNVVFADPYGFMVSEKGSVNAGSLTVNTPTKEFLDQVIDGSGTINTELGARLIDGDVPLSPDGSIVIRGKIRTKSGVYLKANSVSIEGPSHEEQFEATVNTAGRAQGGQIVVRDGKIQIVAAGTAKVGGTLRAGGGRKTGGSIEIVAPDEIDILPTARIEALRAREADTLFAAADDVRKASAGSVTLTSAGHLDVAGEILAEGSVQAGGVVNLTGGSVAIHAGADIAATTAARGAAPALAGARVTVKSGEDLTLAGKLSANGAEGADGGSIEVLAARDIALAASAELSVAGSGANSSAGDILVFADRNLDVADRATIKAGAGTSGNGGFVELSSKEIVSLATINLDLKGRGGGQAGTLFIDPVDIIIGGGTTSGDTQYFGNQLTDGGIVNLLASNSITIKSGYKIDTRQLDANGYSIGNSGAVTLTAPNITVEANALIDASVNNHNGTTYSAGNVSLIAEQTRTDIYGQAGQSDRLTSTITIAGTVKGNTIRLSSLADYTVNSLHAGTTSTITISGTLSGNSIDVMSKARAISDYSNGSLAAGTLNAVLNAINPLGLSAVWVSASSKAYLNVTSTASISGTTVKLQSDSTGRAQDASVGLSVGSSTHLSIPVIVGMVETIAKTDINQPVTLSATESLGVSATTDTKLNILSQVISGAPFVGGTGSPIVAAVAYGGAKVETSAIIHSNTTITGAPAVTVLARADQAYSVNAKVYGRGQAQVGGTLAISEVDSKTVARLGASIDNTSATPVRDVTVQALSNVNTHDTSANTTVGTGVFSDLLQGVGTIGNLVGGADLDISGVGALILGKLMATPAATATTVSSKTAGSLSIAHGSITAEASISGDGGTSLNPSVKAKGNVTVLSDIYSRKVVSNAASGVNSTAKDPTSVSTGGDVGSSVAVAIYDVGHYSRAWVGEGARVEGSHVGVNAGMEMTSPILISDWDSFQQVVVDAVNAYIANPAIFTSGAKSTSESNNISLAGSYNHFNANVQTTAWVGKGATIVSSGATGNWNVDRLTTLGVASTTGGQADKFNFQTAVDIAAITHLESLSVMGNWGLSGNTSGGAAVGGSAGYMHFNVQTIAGIADSATVTAAAAVDVEARTKHFHLVLSPSNGSGSSVAGSGLVALVKVDDKTQASISNRATVTADVVSVKADEVLGIYAGSGQLQYGNGASIGVAISIADINTDTAAFIGRNVGSVPTFVDATTAESTNSGKVTTNELNVRAQTAGTLLVTTIAAALSQPVEAPPPGTPSKALEMLMGSQTVATPKFNLTVTGSSSILLNDLGTRASIDGASVERRSGNAAQVAVQAINTVKSFSISGSASISIGGGGSSVGSAAVAGAIALGGSTNKTIASINASRLDNIKTVVVQGLAGGSYTVAAVGLSASSGNSSLVSLAGSVSIAKIEDTVQGTIRGSDVVGPSTLAGNLSVTAYRRTEISIGGGSLGVGGQGGAGVGLTFTTVRDNAAGPAALALISNSNVSGYVDVSVVAAAPTRIYSGAAAASVLADNGFSGAFVFNDIGGTVMASIEADQNNKKIDISGLVNVKSGTANDTSLSNLLAAATRGGPASINDYSQVKYEDAETGAATEVADGAAIVAIAGNISIGARNIGASVISNTIHQSHIARIAGVEIDAGGAVTVAATDATSILAIGVGVGVSTGEFAGNAAIVNNSVTSSISAEIGKSGRRTDIDAGGLFLTAQDAVVIRGSATAAGVGIGGGGVGIGIAVNAIGMNVDAAVNNTKAVTRGSVEISANSKADILTIAAGVGAGSSFGLAGSAASSKIGTNVRARILGSSNVDADNNVILDSRNSGRISVIAGALGVGLGGVGAGLSVVVNEVGGDTESSISDSTVDADGNGAAKSVRAGDLGTPLNPGAVTGMGFATPNFTQGFASVSGVAVLANSVRTVTGVVVTIGVGGGGPAAAVLPITTVAGGRTIAAIDRSQIDTQIASASNVLVSASSHAFAGNLALGAAVSTAAGAGAATSITTTMNRSTEARVTGSTIGSQTGVARPALLTVEAVASQSASDVATGLAAALVGGAAGSAIVTVFNATTKSFVEDSTVYAGEAAVTAKSTNGYFAAAGAGAGGLFGGAAGAFVVGVSKNTTIARVGATGKTTRLFLNGDLLVDAKSINAFTSNAFGAAGAVIGGAIAAMSLVTVVSNDTEALLRDATITIAPGATVPIDLTTTRPAGITVSAFESLITKAHTGGGGVALLGNGIGAAANVIVLTSKVVADSSGGSIAVPGDVIIAASTSKSVDARTVTLGLGLGNGIGASVAVVIAGGSTASDAMAELNKDGDGTLAMINSASAAAADFLIETTNLGTWRARAGAGSTDAQVQAWARARYLTLIQQGSFTNDGVYVPSSTLDSAAQALALADYAALIRDRASYVLTDAQLVAYSTKALSTADAALFERMSDINTATGITFTPKQELLDRFRAEVTTALGLSEPATDAQVTSYLQPRYQAFVTAIRAQASQDYAALLAKGTVTNGRFTIDAGQIGSLAASTLTADDATVYNTLVAAKTTAADFALANVDAIFADGKSYRQTAAEALGQDLTGAANDTAVQDYFRARYNALVSAIESGADTNYRTMVANRFATQQNFSVTNAASGASEGVYAGVTGGSITSRSVAIDAVSNVSVYNTAWGGGVGGFGSGVGAAVAFTESNAIVQAYSAGNITTTLLAVNATAQDRTGGIAAKTEARAGAGGLMAGIGAAVAISKANNTVTATVGGTVTGTGVGSSLLATAIDKTGISADGTGATTAGGTAVGLAAGTSIKSSTVTATITTASNVSNWALVDVRAATAGEVVSTAQAGAGGVGSALGGAAATSKNVEHVTASVGNGATVSATLVKVTAASTPQATSSAIGVVVAGGAAMGVSTAITLAEAHVTAFVGDDVRIIGGGLNITAATLRPVLSANGATPIVYGTNASAMAAAGTGGILFGANATYAEVNTANKVKAYGGKRLTLPNGTVTISSINDSSQEAESTGIAVGFIGVGATVTKAISTGSSDAYLEENAITASNRSGGLAISAEGTTLNKAKSVAGAGGVYAGAASLATTSDTSTSTAELRTGASAGYTLYTGGLSVDASRDYTFRGTADSFQASAIGASGASTTNGIDTKVLAKIGNRLIVNSTDNIYISASTIILQDGGGARAGGGGVAAGAAALTSTTVDNDNTVEIGNNAILSLNGDPTTFDGKIDIEVFNQLTAADSATVNAGGFFAGGGAVAELDAEINNKIDIKDNVHLFSVGALQVGTASINMSDNRANASLSGLVTGAGASTLSQIASKQDINLGLNAKLEAFGTLNVTAGRAGNGMTSSLVSVNATTEVYNYAVIPITAMYRGDARGYSDTKLTMATGGQLLAGRDIVVGAYEVSVGPTGRGTNHNPYLEIFNTTKTDDNTDKRNTAVAVLNGTIYAGINNRQTVTIGLDGSVSLATQPYAWEFVNADNNSSTSTDVSGTFVSYNQRKLRYDVANSYNPYADIVSKIATMLNLSTTVVRERLAADHDIFYGTNPTLEVRRQVETFVLQIATGSVPDRTVNTVAIGSIMASAGNVTINAVELSGTATVTAKGAPRIDIINNGPGYVLLNKLLLTTNEGGNVRFSGAAGNTPGITTVEDLAAATPQINVRSNWRDPLGNVPSPSPDIYFLGDVSNLAGTMTVRNEMGNVSILSRNFEAATIDMQVPYGNLTVNMGTGSVYETNSSVMSQWRGTQIRPSNVGQAVMMVATYMEPQALNYTFNGGTHNSDGIFTARTLVRQYFNSIPQTIHGIANGPNYASGLVSDVWFKVYQNNTTAESQTGQTAEFKKGWYQWEAWNGDGDGSGPFNSLRFDVIQRQTLSKTAATAVNPPDIEPQIIGGSILITAAVINVNGTLQSGYSNAYSVNIGAAAAEIIANYKNNAGLRAANAGRLIELPVDAVNGTLDTKLRAYYDVSNDRIEVQNVSKGGGGRVYLNGGIISTSTSGTSQGLIRVNGGYATVDVRNSTGTNLVVNTINTGEGTNSIVEIVDHFKMVNGAPTRTWYVYDISNPNAPVSKYQQVGNANVTDYRNAALLFNSSSQTQNYTLDSDLLYRWVETATMSREVNDSNVQLGEWAYDSTNADPFSVAKSVVRGSQSTNFRQDITGTGSYVVVDKDQDYQNGTDFKGHWVQNVYNRATLIMTNTVKASYTIGIEFIGSATGTVSVTSNSSITLNKAVSNINGATYIAASGANSAINVGAEGSVSGRSVTLVGGGGIGSADRALPVTLYGGALTASSTNTGIYIDVRGNAAISSIAAGAGDIRLRASGDIYSTAAYNVTNPIISGRSIRLESSSGAIGARSSANSSSLTNINPIIIQTGAGGVLNSSSSGGTYIAQSRGNLYVGRVESSGTVYLAAAGSDGQPANILADTNIGLTDAERTRLETLWTSLNLLGTATQDGTYDARGDLNTANYAGSAAVHGYEAMINRAYKDYWQLRTIAFDEHGDYSMSDTGLTAMKAQMAAQQGKTAADISDEDVEAEARIRFATARFMLGLSTDKSMIVLPGNQLDSLTGAPANAALTAAIDGGYDKDFSYRLDSGSSLYTQLTSGAVWTRDQLTYTIDSAANPANATPVPTLAQLGANVVGRDILLYAPTGAIGKLAAPRTFTFTSDNPGALNTVDRAAISAAGPGDLSVASEALGGGRMRYTITLAEQDLVVADASGSVSARASGAVYIGSHDELKLGGISTSMLPGGTLGNVGVVGVRTVNGGEVRLEAGGDITAGIAGQTAIGGPISRLTLISETGSIGRAGLAGVDPAQNMNALLVDMTAAGGTLDLAKAFRGIYLRQVSGDLILGNISGGSGSLAAVQLGTTGSIYAQAQFTNRTVAHIIGSSLDLRAGGSISFAGSNFRPLQVQITGAVTGHAGGNFTLLSPTESLTVGTGTEAFNMLTADGNLAVDVTGGSLTLNRPVTAGGTLTLNANNALILADSLIASALNGALSITAGSISMGAGAELKATGAITIVSTGDAVLGRVSTTLASTVSPVIDILAGASGSIRGNGDSGANLVTVAGAGLKLKAGNAINLTVDTDWLTAETNTGTLSITAVNGLVSSMIKSTLGAVSISGRGLLDLADVRAGAGARIVSSHGAVKLGTLVAGTFATVESKDDVDIDAIDAGTDIIVDVTDGKIAAASLKSLGAANLTASTSIDITTLDIGTTLTSNAGTTTTFSDLDAGTSFDIVSGGLIDIGSADSVTGSGKLKSTTGKVQFGTVNTGTSVEIDAHTDIQGTTLTSGTSADLKAGDAIDIATLGIGTTLTSDAGTTTTFTDLDAGTSFDVSSAGLIDIGSADATTGSGKLKSTTGKVQFGTVNTGTSAEIDARTDIQGTTLTSGTSADLKAGGAIDIATLDIGTTLTSDAGTTTTFTDLDAGTSFDIVSGGLSDIGSADATTGSGKLKSTTGKVQFGTVNTGTSAEIDAHTGIEGTTLTSGTSADLKAGTAIDIATLDIGTTLTSDAGTTTTFSDLDAGTSFDIVSAGLISIGSADATNGSGKLKSTTDKVSFGTVNTGTSAEIDAHTDISGTTLTSGTSADLKAGGEIYTAVLDIGTTLTSDAGMSTTFADLDAGTSFDIVSGGLIDIGTADTITGSGKLKSATGKVQFVTVNTGTSAEIDAHTDIQGTTLTAGTSADLKAGGVIDITTINAGGNASLDSGGATLLGSLTAGGNVSVNASRIAAGTLTAGGSALLSSRTTLDVGTLTIGASLMADSGSPMTLTQALVGGSLTLNAPTITLGTVGASGDMTIRSTRAINGTDLSAGGLMTMSTAPSGTIRIGRASAARFATTGSASFDANDLRLGESGSFAAELMRIGTLTHTGTGRLALDFTGATGGSATKLTLALDAADVAIGDYRVVDSTIETTGGFLSIARGYVQGQMTLQTAARRILMNNRRVTPVRGYDVQLFQPSFAFRLKQENFRTTTNAFIVQFGQGSEVVFEQGGQLFPGTSIVRELETVLASVSGNGGGSSQAMAIFSNGELQQITAAFIAQFLSTQTQNAMIEREDDDKPAVNMQRP